MNYKDMQIMYEELSHIRRMLLEYQDTLEDREWANFHDFYEPQLKRFDWMISTLDEEMTEYEANYDWN